MRFGKTLKNPISKIVNLPNFTKYKAGLPDFQLIEGPSEDGDWPGRHFGKHNGTVKNSLINETGCFSVFN